jgi:hypothetical protein
MYYVRKIEEKSWNKRALLDAVSISDLCTKDNDISVWIDDGSANRYQELCLAYMLTRSEIKDMWCVRIPDSEILEQKLTFHQVPSSTSYLPMRDLHTNIVVPTLYELGYLAEIIYELIKNGQAQYVTEQELKDLFYDAVKADKVEIDFNDTKFKKLRKTLSEMETINGEIDFSLLHKVKDKNK